MGEAIRKEPMTSLLRIRVSVLAAVLFLCPSLTHAAILSFSPASATATVGESVTETVLVSSPDQAMNAVSGTISFPQDILQVVSISKTNSVLSLWVQEPSFSNANGSISFAGIAPNPGYIGGRGQILSIQFRAKKQGTAEIALTSASEVLANDGNGTDILTATRSATITVSAAQAPPPQASPSAPSQTASLLARITSSSHPDETKWYALSHAVFDWTNAQDVTAVRLGYDKDADGIPTVLYNDPISHKELDLEEGIWYFHVQEKGTGGWGPVSTFRVQIDQTPPLPFPIIFLNGTTTAKFGDTIPVQFAATDELSGIDRYQVIIDGKESVLGAEEGSRPYAIAGDSGTHALFIRAHDKAGNAASTEGSFSIAMKESAKVSFFTFGWVAINYLTLILIALAILGTLFFAAWYIRVHFSAYRRNLNRRLGTTHTRVHKEFDNLKDAITEEILALEQAKSRRSLTREEERLISRFKKLLDQSEQAIEKELEEIPR